MSKRIDGNGSDTTSGGEQRNERKDQASAEFLYSIEAASGYEKGQIWLGVNGVDKSAVGILDDRHQITIAGNRAGKGESCIIPNLCEYPGSVLCLDPKGENATITATRRNGGSEFVLGLGQKVVVLDPYKKAKVPKELRGGYNPLDMIETGSSDAASRAEAIAEAIVVTHPSSDPHWDESARKFISALVLYIKASEPAQSQNLVRARELIMVGDEGAARELEANARQEDPETEGMLADPFECLLEKMKHCQDFKGRISRFAISFARKSERERQDILSIVERSTAFVESEIEDSLKHSSFSFEDLKTDIKGLTVYLCLPVSEYSKDARWYRLLISQAIGSMEHTGLAKPAVGFPVLFLLDEFAALGTMPTIEKAVPYLTGFGVKLWIILQGLQQLQSIYKNTWETFLDNAGVLQCFSINGGTTAKYLSERLGMTEVRQMLKSSTTGSQHTRSKSETAGKTFNSSSSRSRDRSATRSPHGLLFAGRKQNEGESRGMANQSGFSDSIQYSASASEGGSESESISETISVAPLMRPEEIELEFARERKNSLVIISGNLPIILERVLYHNEEYFECKYEANPTHPETAPMKIKELVAMKWKKTMGLRT